VTEPSCRFEVFTIFPEVVDGFVRAGVLGRAIEREVVDVRATNIRDFTTDKHRSVDDSPFGGGAGMVMKPGPIVDALEHVTSERGPMHRIMLTPSAPRFDQRAAERLARLPRIALVCGRYEGIDERVRDHYIDECFSIGDYVLGGGEVAALVLIEAIARLVEGVMGNPTSAESESFSQADDGEILEYPQYTRPAEYRGHRVPDVLLGGDHQAVERWRAEAARRRTWALRPDLRPRRKLPPAEHWLAVQAEGDIDIPSLARVAMHHRVAGVALLGATPDAAAQWAAATGGKIPGAALTGLKALQKRLRRGSGAAPWVVRLAEPDESREGTDELAHGAQSPSELADVLGQGPVGHAMVLWLADRTHPDTGRVDAEYAPSLDAVQRAQQGLAIPGAIEEGPPPRQQPAAIADVALATLAPAAEEPGDADPRERDEP